MKLLTCMLTRNRWFNSEKTIPMSGIVVHSSGANNSRLSRYVQPTPGQEGYWPMMKLLGTNQYNNDWNHGDQDYGMHAFVGKLADGTVASVQTLPWDSFLWGCGTGSKGSYNNTHIQFEICEDTTDPGYTQKAYREAVELCAYLCDEFNIRVSNIVGHYEAHEQGFASSHVDPSHWWVLYGRDMNEFRRDVQNVLNGYDIEEVDIVRYNKLAEVPEWAQTTIKKLMDKGYLTGDGSGLGLTGDMVRMLVILDRAGVFGK